MRLALTNRAKGSALHSMLDLRHDQRNLKHELNNVPRASGEAVREVAVLLHVRMRQIGSESAGGERKEHDSWFKLFKHMDDDGSGKVAYLEFEGLVREELLLTTKELPEPALKAVWAALDDDNSGSISVGEFGAFMRKGKSNE